jgi:hypothetical protein
VLVALVMTGGMRPVALLAGAYIALTLFAASYQPMGVRDQFAHFLAHASRIGALHDDVNLHALVTWLGLRSWMAGASGAVLALMAWWLWQHRRCDLWLLLGVTALATRFWTYHRWYDDLLVVVPLVTLFRLAKGGANAPDRRAGALFALTLVLLLAPGGLYLLPAPWVHAYVGAQVALWISAAVYLAMAARSEVAERTLCSAGLARRG